MRQYYTVYRGNQGTELSLGYDSFRVVTATRELASQEKVWAFSNRRLDFINAYNSVARYQIWQAWWTVQSFIDGDPPVDSRDGLGLVPVFDIRTAGDDPYTIHDDPAQLRARQLATCRRIRAR